VGLPEVDSVDSAHVPDLAADKGLHSAADADEERYDDAVSADMVANGFDVEFWSHTRLRVVVVEDRSHKYEVRRPHTAD
jgi:hypothetical protein